MHYRGERADLIQVYKILHNIDKIEKEKLFTMAKYTHNRGHSLKQFKHKARLNIRRN